MLNLTPLKLDPFTVYESIRDSKRHPGKKYLNKLTSAIRKRYQEYESHFQSNTLQNLTQINYKSDEHKHLLGCYENDTAALKLLLQDIIDNQSDYQRAVCQYCGISEPKTFDHYLPKSVYPDYSVNAKNLFPCCSTCNSSKLDYWIDPISHYRGIINFYTDNLPPVQFLFLSIDYDHSRNVYKAQFSLDNRNNIDSALFSTITSHFNRLRLIDRYTQRYPDIQNRAVKPCQSILKKGGGIQEIRSRLSEEATTLMELHGVNDFEAVVYDTLSREPNLLSFLSANLQLTP